MTRFRRRHTGSRNRRGQRALAGLGLALLAPTLLAPALTPGIASALPTADGKVDQLVARFDECAASEGDANVVVLLDQSASLADSDPDGQRAVAGGQFARQLAEYAGAADVQVGVKVAGFAGDYESGDWTKVTGPDDAGALQQQITKVGGQRDGRETDYWNALQGASSDLAAAPSKCRLLLFFTDGEYDVDGSYGTSKPYSDRILSAKTGPAVEADGKASICSAKQGPLNRLRAAGAQFAVIGLTGKDDPDLSFLQSIALGSEYDGKPCGSPREPGESAYLEVADAGALVFALGSITGGDTKQGRYANGRAQIDFGLDAYITKASVLADAGTSLGEVQTGISGPDGSEVWIEGRNGSATVSGAQVSYEALSARTSTFAITMPRSGDQAAGTWAVRYRARKGTELPADALAQARISVEADLDPKWTNPVDQAIGGRTLDVRATVLAGGKPLRAELGSAQLSVGYRDGGATTELATGTPAQFEVGQAVKLAGPNGKPLPPGAGKLVLRLDVTTVAQPPTKLKASVTSYPLTIAAPGNYPTVDSTPVQLHDAEGNLIASGVTDSLGAVAVTGPGCVWVDLKSTGKALAALPDGTSAADLAAEARSRKTCLELEKGQQASLPFTVTPDAQGNGVIAGQLQVVAAPDNGAGEPLVVPVSFTAQREKQLNSPMMWTTFLVALLLGLGIPAALLFGVRRASARIVVADPLAGYLSYALLDVMFSDGRVVQAGTGAPVRVSRTDVRAVAVPAGRKSVRSLDVAGVALTARSWGNPFRPADVAVSPGPGHVAGNRLLLCDDGRPAAARVRLPLSVQGHWVAWPTVPVGGVASGAVLVLFSGNDSGDAGLAEISERLQDGLAARAGALADLFGVQTGTDGATGQDGRHDGGSEDGWAYTQGESQDW